MQTKVEKCLKFETFTAAIFPLFFPGEAAGLGMGLVMVGTKSAQAIEDMVAVSSRHAQLTFSC